MDEFYAEEGRKQVTTAIGNFAGDYQTGCLGAFRNRWKGIDFLMMVTGKDMDARGYIDG